MSEPERYMGGEEPMRGDLISFDRDATTPSNKEARNCWIVTSICGDMIRAKCDGAPLWRQAFYTSKMVLLSRKKP